MKKKHNCHLPASVGLQSFLEIEGGHVNYCVDLTWNDLIINCSRLKSAEMDLLIVA
jgi:hypothetical protein